MKFFLLVVMPVLEIVTAFLVGRWIGFGWMLLALIALSILGVFQVKVQGIAAWRTARKDALDGSSPAPAAVDGVWRFVGALLLAVPGFISAVVGVLLLIGPVRNGVSRQTGSWVVGRLQLPFVVVRDDGTTGWTFRSSKEPEVVDVESWEEPTSEDGATGSPTLSPPTEPRP